MAALLNVHHRLAGSDAAEETGLDDLLDLASVFGEKLFALAVWRDEGWSWDTMDSGAQDHLTCFSHGAAGIAWSLLELFDATGDERF